jgi:hypothetical protein
LKNFGGPDFFNRIKSDLKKFGSLFFCRQLKNLPRKKTFVLFGDKLESVISKVQSLNFFIQVESLLTSKRFSEFTNFTPQIRLISRFFLTIFREVGIFVAFPNFQSQ